MFAAGLEDGILYLEFHAPEFGNSLGLQDSANLLAILKKHKSARAVIVRSKHPRIFCSGGRLSDYAKLKKREQGLLINKKITKNLDAFAAWKGLKIALVNGDCLGGGMEWLSCFDFRLASPHVLFSFWQRRIALSPGWGGGKRWAQFLPEARLRQLLMSAEVFGVEQALRSGLIDRVLPAHDGRSEAREFAKRILSHSSDVTADWSVKNENKIFSRLWWREEHLRALKPWK